ncbi:phospholipase D family protein [Roseivirga seohaensis]|uniref:phospholipase D family protein n=1 Tax=Roseivirga seohaensis TaxID=1914963 RepID=UPI003BACABD2
MIIFNLEKELEHHFLHATEIYVAIALADKNIIQKSIDKASDNALQRVLIGVDLPTSVETLKYLRKKEETTPNFKCGIYYDMNRYFHPKAYLFKEDSGWVGIIGSANFTLGGLSKNIELSYLTRNQRECEDMFNWFDKLFEDCYPINDENLAKYASEAEMENQEGKSKKRKFSFKKPTKSRSPLDGIDFTDRFFKYEHHWAFRKELWRDTSSDANNERYKALKKFEELHSVIFPQFNDYGLGELDHNVKNHLASMYYHLEGSTSQDLEAMWLSYGKKREEIKQYHDLFPSADKHNKSDEDDKQSFINHSRLQIRLDFDSIGIWLLFGKNNGGSLFDRNHFFDKMKHDSYRNEFYLLLTSLPKEYWIEVNEERKVCSSFRSEDLLYQFCKKDDPQKYFIIGRDYNITDVEMSESQLPATTLKVFELLFPLHQKMRDNLSRF